MHKGEKPYKCDVCDAKFRYCSQVSNHKKLHLKIKNCLNFKELKVMFIQLTDLLANPESNDILRDDAWIMGYRIMQELDRSSLDDDEKDLDLLGLKSPRMNF